MAENVFILGAGASKDAGIPVMNEFIKEGLDLKDENRIHSERNYFDKIDEILTSLTSSLFSKVKIDLNNIEDVFGLIEMGRLINKFPDIDDKDEIEALHKAIIKFIVITIEQKNLYKHEDGKIESASEAYGEFSEEIIYKLWETQGNSCSIITFNYDVALDYSLHFNSIPFDYCFNESIQRGHIKLIKLHGSINWGICSKCNMIIPMDFNEYFSKFYGPFDTEMLPELIPIPIGSKIHLLKHCQTYLKDTPLLVPPTWNKTEYHAHLFNVWGHAAIELSEAENIFIIGYSMPETDLFFKYMLGLGTINPQKRLKKFWIFNPSEDEKVEERYNSIKGQGIERQFDFKRNTFKESISIIMDGLKLSSSEPSSGFTVF